MMLKGVVTELQQTCNVRLPFIYSSSDRHYAATQYSTDFQQCITHINQYITLFIYNTVTRKSILHQPALH